MPSMQIPVWPEHATFRSQSHNNKGSRLKYILFFETWIPERVPAVVSGVTDGSVWPLHHGPSPWILYRANTTHKLRTGWINFTSWLSQSTGYTTLLRRWIIVNDVDSTLQQRRVTSGDVTDVGTTFSAEWASPTYVFDPSRESNPGDCAIHTGRVVNLLP